MGDLYTITLPCLANPVPTVEAGASLMFESVSRVYYCAAMHGPASVDDHHAAPQVFQMRLAKVP